VNYLKVLIGAALTTAVMMAAMAGSASASGEPTKLCKANEAHCSAANTYGPGTVLKFETNALTITGKSGTMNCQSSLEAEVISQVGVPALATTHSSFGECYLVGSQPRISCTTQGRIGVPTEFLDEGGAPGDGSSTMHPYVIEQTCGSFGLCEYSTASAKSQFSGGTAGVANVVANKIALTRKGPACLVGAGTYFSAKWVLTSPASLYITH
jgi:hypothetical protein